MGETDKEDEIAKTLLIGPTSGEAGWMLQFAMRARAKAKEYDNVVVYCEDWQDYLFQDFATSFLYYSPGKGWRDRWFFDGKRQALPPMVIDSIGPDKMFQPTEKHCLGGKCEPFQYGAEDTEDPGKYDVIIHARNIKRGDWIDRKCGGSHNYGLKSWNSVVNSLKNRKIACVGDRNQSRHIGGTDDLRGISLRKLCIYMANAKVVVGESSFPMHLASMCKAPHVVITHGAIEKSIGATNATRYKRMWNPFRTKCSIVEHPKWQPKPESVINAVQNYL